MTWIDVAGYVAAVLVFATFWMKTMILLRGFAIASNVAFLAYSFFGDLYPVLALHSVLLPLNVYRLWEMRQLIEAVKHAGEGTFSMDWAVPHARKTRLEEGATLFRKGEQADAMYCLLEGKARVVEFGVALGEGEMIGEIGLFSESGRRTATVVCATQCEFLVLGYDTVRQLSFQNPAFGFHLVNLITRRLVANLEEMEAGGRAAGKGITAST